MKVLVTGAGAVLGQGIIRSLRASSLHPEIVVVDPSPLAAGLYWAQNRHLVPMANDPSFLESLGSIVERERPDAVIPGTDVELYQLAVQRREWELRYGTQVIVSDPSVISIADDKYKTYTFLKRAGFPVPDSCLPGEEEALLDRVGFPLIVKPRVGARSVGVVTVNDRASLKAALTQGNLIIQECVSSDDREYTAGTVVFEGTCRASIVMRRDLRDGNTYRAYVDEYPALDAQVRRMAEALGAYGPVNFQFRADAHGTAKVFEINARFSGTTPFRMRAGFNEVEMVLRRVVLGEPIEQPTIQPMTILRHFEETVILPGGLVES
jgi:carbamoyl-phosphate synthase large subunit